MNLVCRSFWKLCFLLLLLFVAGCATKIDWAARVGNYTYDQAVNELGPPERFAKLDDGTLVAEWMYSRGRPYVYAESRSVSPDFGPSYYRVSQSADFYWRLTFGPDHKLLSWKKFAR